MRFSKLSDCLTPSAFGVPGTLVFWSLTAGCEIGSKPSMTHKNGGVSDFSAVEIASLNSAPKLLGIAEARGGLLRITAVLAHGRARVFEGSLASGNWNVKDIESDVTIAIPAPMGFPVELVMSNGRSVTAVESKGDAKVLLADLRPTEKVIELQALAGSPPSVFAMIEDLRGQRPALVRVVRFSVVGGALQRAETVAEFEASPGQAAMRACSAGDQMILTTASSLLRETGRQLASEAAVFAWRASPRTGMWQQSENLLRDKDIGATVTFSPGAVTIGCGIGGSTDILFRSGGGWLVRSTLRDSWSEPERILEYGPGYGLEGRTVGLCSGHAIWIDDRLERGVGPRIPNPVSGFPWSDDYPGWGINSLFSERVEVLIDSGRAPKGRPTLLSSPVGRQTALAVEAVGEDCVAVWSGQSKVPKASEHTEDLAQRLFLKRLSVR